MDAATRHAAEHATHAPRPFARTSRWLTRTVGSLRWVLGLGAAALAWTVVGIWYDFPHWWEITVTVGSPFLTLTLLALVQHTENHNSNAIELKLDALLRAIDPESDAMVRIEEASEEDLERLQAHFAELRSARQHPGPVGAHGSAEAAEAAEATRARGVRR